MTSKKVPQKFHKSLLLKAFKFHREWGVGGGGSDLFWENKHDKAKKIFYWGFS